VNKRLEAMFNGIEDPRVDRTRKHPLETILYIVLCGTLAGISSWTGFEDYAEAHEEALAKLIDLSAGIPSHDTIGRVIEALDVESFSRCFREFANQIVEKAKGIIAIDGKTMRGSFDVRKNISARHIVSAWSDCCKVVLAQVKVHDKSNEITAIPELLDLLDLHGQVVTIDAMGCQREICEVILNKSGDYVISLKGNQGNLHKDIDLFFTDKAFIPTHEWEEWDKGHGRIEGRKCFVSNDIDWLQESHNWPGLKSLAVVHSSRETRKGIQTEKRYYISSLEPNAERIAKAARSHWGIENSLHWVLDVTFNEDGSRIRNENAPEILSMIKKWGLNIINQHRGTLSVKRTLAKIAMSPKFLIEILGKI
jgi:predicted transposase YbfD/YdcC